MLILVFLLAVGLTLAAFLLLRRRSDGAPTGWTAVTAGNGYGATVEADGSFDFPRGDPATVATLPVSKRPGVHCVTKGCNGLAGHSRIRMRYKIEGGPFYPSSDPAQPTIGPTLYFQRAGDDWSGAGQYDGYRWFATLASPQPIEPGEHEVVAPFDSRWTGVEHFNSIDDTAAFVDAVKDAERVGFVFGGGTGYGHGVFGAGRFTLLEFAVE